MNTKLSICVFIRNNNSGGFGLWESMATLMPLADEFFVLDLGSDDGTWEILKDLSTKNPKLRVEQSEFPVNPETKMVDAGSFAVLPNQMIPTCKNDMVMYYQADEIWHEDLVAKIPDAIEEEDFRGLSFWRYQLCNNFQHVKWYPHLVHRVDRKEGFHFTGDGMNTDRTNDAKIVGDYDGGWFTRWGAEFQDKSLENKYRNLLDRLEGEGWGEVSYSLPTDQMVLDISSIGGFLENIHDKATMHAPLWRASNRDINIGGTNHNFEWWYNRQKDNPDWTKKESPFNIPEIMKPLVGETRYPVREDLLHKIANS